VMNQVAFEVIGNDMTITMAVDQCHCARSQGLRSAHRIRE